MVAMIERAYTHDDEYYYQIVRQNIRKYRTAKNLTQQELSEMTDMSREYITDIENEGRNKHLTIAVLERIAEVLKTPIGDFFSTK